MLINAFVDVGLLPYANFPDDFDHGASFEEDAERQEIVPEVSQFITIVLNLNIFIGSNISSSDG